MIAPHLTEYFYWALGVAAFALLLAAIIFLARWYFTGRIPRSSYQPLPKQEKTVGTSLAWLNLFKD